MRNSFNENHSENVEKVEQTLNHLSEDKKQDILSNFESFKDYLGDKVIKGKKLGLTEEQLAKSAEMVAGYLARYEEPKNREEKLLQELWKAGDVKERGMLAHMLVKLVN
ncbi:DUF3243 domain-containing protein [Metabacillus arenae]|uniref:DUF3243 domain-containing protein n=1 Tax=Metabacillus arenae TaxID=2771434 RepID=A0A926NEY6_9BACI|nr:DUF3243 domain-containing protein [Metabacillus arenae]MBD1380304.1 DUF3243 domain-containing protein [Metabacillus arenae]